MINYLQVENLTKSYGDLVLFDNISFTIGEGQRIALIGRNGSGKTTLLNILAGKDTADSGTITPRRDLRIAYLEQNPEYAADLTVLEACFRSDNPALRAIAAYEQAVADPAQDGLPGGHEPYGCPRCLGLRTAGQGDSVPTKDQRFRQKDRPAFRRTAQTCGTGSGADQRSRPADPRRARPTTWIPT